MENDLFIAKKTGIFTMRLFDTIMIPFVVRPNQNKWTCDKLSANYTCKNWLCWVINIPFPKIAVDGFSLFFFVAVCFKGKFRRVSSWQFWFEWIRFFSLEIRVCLLRWKHVFIVWWLKNKTSHIYPTFTKITTTIFRDDTLRKGKTFFFLSN